MSSNDTKQEQRRNIIYTPPTGISEDIKMIFPEEEYKKSKILSDTIFFMKQFQKTKRNGA